MILFLRCSLVIFYFLPFFKKAIRFAPGFFTDDEDTELALEAVTELAEYQASR